MAVSSSTCALLLRRLDHVGQSNSRVLGRGIRHCRRGKPAGPSVAVVRPGGVRHCRDWLGLGVLGSDPVRTCCACPSTQLRADDWPCAGNRILASASRAGGVRCSNHGADCGQADSELVLDEGGSSVGLSGADHWCRCPWTLFVTSSFRYVSTSLLRLRSDRVPINDFLSPSAVSGTSHRRRSNAGLE